MSNFEDLIKQEPANDNEEPHELGPKRYPGALGEPERDPESFGEIENRVVDKFDPDKKGSLEEWIDGEPPAPEDR